LALPLANTFETALADGTTITTGNSDDGTAGAAFDAVSIGSSAAAIFSTTQKAHGSLSGRVTQAAVTPVTTQLKWNTAFGTQTNWYGRTYVRWPALPGGASRHVFLQFWSIGAGAYRGSIWLGSDGFIRVEDSAGATTAGSTSISTDTWYRVEWHWIGGTSSDGTLEAKVFAADATSPLETWSRTNVTMGASADEVSFQMTTESLASFQVYFDSLQINATAYPGPLTNPQLLRPTADSVVGAYTTQAGGTTDLYQTIDETTASDADYVQSALAPSSAVYRFKLGTGTDPNSSSGHVIRWRVGKSPSDGQVINATFRIYQGGGNSAGAGTLIKTATRNAVTSFTTYEETLSGGEADTITNYADLYGEIVATQA
jgi:hypothetical protein